MRSNEKTIIREPCREICQAVQIEFDSNIFSANISDRLDLLIEKIMRDILIVLGEPLNLKELCEPV